MRQLRVVAKLIAVCATCVVFYSFLTVTSAGLASWRWLRRDPRGTGEWRTRVFRIWCRVLASWLAIRIETGGQPPHPPFYLVSNHLSYIDILVLGSQLPAVFVSKAEVADWPILGRLCKAVDTLFINRESKRDIPRVMQRIEKLMSGTSRGVIVFPEGTSSRGAEVLRFRPSLLETAVRAGIPVSYVSLSYRTAEGELPAHRSVCWWGGMGFMEHIRELLSLRRIIATVNWGEEPILDPDRKELARRLHRAVEARFQPVI